MLKAGRTTALVLSLIWIAGCGQQSRGIFETEVAGSEFVVRVAYTTETEGDVSSSRSSGHSTLIERVLELEPETISLEYDLPEGMPEERRRMDWRFPARVRIDSHGTAELLNSSELARRNLEWREAAGIPEDACGQWYFTWTAMKIECDPQSVVEFLEPFLLVGLEAYEGSILTEQGTSETQTLQMVEDQPRRLQAIFQLSPETIRETQAEADVVVAQFSGAEKTLEDALLERANHQVSGQLTTQLDLDGEGRVIRRTRETEVNIVFPDGLSERQTQSQVTTRILSERQDKNSP